MISCDEALDLISASLDGALTPEAADALETHLHVCGACRALRADLECLHQELPALNAPVPEGLTQRILEGVRAEKVVPLPTRPARRWRQWAASAAVFAVVLLGAGGLGAARIAGMAGPAAVPQDVSRKESVSDTTAPEKIDAHAGGTAPAAVSVPPAEDLPAPAGNAPAAAPETLPGSPQERTLPSAPPSAPPSAGDTQDKTVSPSAVPDSEAVVSGAQPFSLPGDVLAPEEDAALDRLLAWLGWEDAVREGRGAVFTAPDGTELRLTCAGVSEDGYAVLFDVQLPEGTVRCSVPGDGSPISSVSPESPQP